MKSYRYKQDGISYGPYLWIQILSLVQNGTIKANDEIRCTNDNQTIPMSRIVQELSGNQPAKETGITISDVDMTVDQMVRLMLKVGIASIPAALVFGAIMGFFALMAIGLLGTLVQGLIP